MAYNPFIGWEQEELLRALRDAQEELASGSSVNRVGAGDVSTGSQVDKSPETRIEMLYRALSILDPTTFPPGQITRIDRTRIRFDLPIYPNQLNTQQ